MRELIELLMEHPGIVYQLWYDMEASSSPEEGFEWRRRGESSASARDRIAAERAALLARSGGA